MYAIYAESGKLLTYVDKLYFIKKSNSGSYIKSDSENAEGLSVNSTPYNLLGVNKLDDNLETVYYEEVDSGNIIKINSNNIDNLLINLLEG